MKLALLLLAACLTACRKPAPAAPGAAALAVELTTYRQVLVLLAPESLEYKEVYAYGETLIAGSTVPVMLAYSGAWLLPRGSAARPMTPPQYLRVLMNDETAVRAVLITPKGNMVVAREQTFDVLLEMTKSGSPPADLPYAVVRASK